MRARISQWVSYPSRLRDTRAFAARMTLPLHNERTLDAPVPKRMRTVQRLAWMDRSPESAVAPLSTRAEARTDEPMKIAYTASVY